jgi:hypothetical protein
VLRDKRRPRIHLDAFKTNGSSPPKFDLLVHGGGTVYLLRLVRQVRQRWIADHISADAVQFAGAVVIEHRYIGDIVAGATADGLGLK